MKRLLTTLGVALILAACQSGGDAGGGGSVSGDTSPIQWDRSPGTIVFRADIVGGVSEGTFQARNEIPLCTVYGDNRVVWLNEAGPFTFQVLWDRVPDEAIRSFVEYLTVVERFYTYDAQADRQPASAVSPVVEVMTLFVNGQEHKTDAFGGWEVDYFERILNLCKTISQTPVLFEPTEGWVSAQQVEYDSNAPGVPWDGEASNLSLAELAASGERRWITDRNVPIIWEILRSSPPSVQFIEDNITYQVALEVPFVTRDAPPPPSSG